MYSGDSIVPIPSDTAKAARAILGQNNLYLTVGDSWGAMITQKPDEKTIDEASQGWMPPALALGTLLQTIEKLSDRQAEEASRLRVDWKYALHLSMFYPGLSRGRLCQYRQRVFLDLSWQQELQSILDRLVEQDRSLERRELPVTAVDLLYEVCSRSRLEQVMLALRRALEALATKHPQWLRDNILPHWYTRYHLFQAAPDLPHSAAQQDARTEAIGADILYLFKAISDSNQPELGELEEVIALHQTWLEQFELIADGVRRLPRCSFCGSLRIGGEKGE